MKKKRTLMIKAAPGSIRFPSGAIPLLFLALVAFSAAAPGQSASSNYILGAGAAVGGGGTSSSTGYAVVGCVPLSAAGNSVSTNYIGTGGLIGAVGFTTGVTALYVGDPVMEVNAGTARAVKVAYSGGTGTVSGTFRHRLGGATTYSSAAMSAGTADTLVYNVPGAILGVRGLEYYFEIADAAGTFSIRSGGSPYVFVCQLTNAQAQRPAALPDARYRIVGLPVDPQLTGAAAVFLDELGAADPIQWRLASYNTASGEYDEYPGVAAVVPGQGYWLIARGGKRYGSAGASVIPTRDYGGSRYYEISLDSGWNLTANPFPFDVTWSEILFDTGGYVVGGHPVQVVDNAAYWYNGSGYQLVSEIPAWDGAFIRVNYGGGATMLVPYHEAAARAAMPKEPAEPADPDEWSLEIRLEADGLYDAENYAGVRYEARAEADQFDMHEPPPAPGAPRLAFRIPSDQADLYRTDFRRPFEYGDEWELSLSPAKGRELILNGLERLPSGMEAVLVLDSAIVMRPENNSRIFVPDEVTAARLIVGNQTYMDRETKVGLPDTYELGQNYPNPFNPFTIINFALPEPVHVRLEVHNILGQKVKTLVDAEMEQGRHTAIWSGDDEDGQPVASGIYFYRLTANNFRECRKMVLLK